MINIDMVDVALEQEREQKYIWHPGQIEILTEREARVRRLINSGVGQAAAENIADYQMLTEVQADLTRAPKDRTIDYSDPDYHRIEQKLKSEKE